MTAGSYLDHVIFEHVHWRDIDPEEMAAEAKRALERSLDDCQLYRRLSDAGICVPTGEAVVPSYLFKKFKIHHENLASSGFKECVSSGTLGSRSVVLRDDRTLERFVGTVSYGIDHFLGDDHDRRRAFVLGPSAEEAGDIWFSYVLSLVEVVYQTDFFSRDGTIDFGGLYRELAEEKFYQPILVGPPALISDFISYLDRNRLRLSLGGKDALIITAGGWKNRQAEQIDRIAFRSLCARSFDIPTRSVRDSFNMVELNTVLFECEHHRMHVPPWLTALAIDPSTMVATSGVGALAFIDPSAVSYPGAIFSEDVGLVGRDPCPCGLESDYVVFERRVRSNEQRGCALKLSQYDGA